MENIWFTSDHHFGHANIIKYENRPFHSVGEMNGMMLARWNEKIRPNDLVYHLGDLIFAKRQSIDELVPKLNGRKILIRGNHDKGPQKYLDAGFIEVVEKKIIDIDGWNVILCHYPYKNASEVVLKYMERRPDDHGAWLIHGHSHGSWKLLKRMINVSVENWDYYPVHIDTIRAIINGTYQES